MFTARRFALAIITLPFVGVVYGAIYFGLALVANTYASLGLYLSNITALAFAWIIAVTFSKQILDFINKIGE
jgi:hypothetical protein